MFRGVFQRCFEMTMEYLTFQGRLANFGWEVKLKQQVRRKGMKAQWLPQACLDIEDPSHQLGAYQS